ncbi:MAG TPA: helix-turn-helix domain-containing protein [Opitutus sp.]|nr:helix-turn-helix domain-containing protein [Opitutus sp.]
MPAPRPTQHRPTLGFRAWRVAAHGEMPSAHTHPDMEFNFLHRGRVTILLGGARHVIESGRLAVFWGGVPHQTLPPGVDGDGIWLTLPLAWLLQWRLPGGVPDRLLAGELIQRETPATQIECWLADFESGRDDRRRALQLELEAWLLRGAVESPFRSVRRRPELRNASQIERIIGHLAAHYRDALTVDDIARAVRLHPKYLMRLFKRHCRIGVWEYLTRLRVSHAQRLLVTTDARVADIALDSGFGSPAAFYQAFANYSNGEKPLDYRRRHESGAAGSPV